MWKTSHLDPLAEPAGRIKEALKRAGEQVRFGLEDLAHLSMTWPQARGLLRERVLAALVSPMRAEEREALFRWRRDDGVALDGLLDQLGTLLGLPVGARAEPRRQLELRLFAIVGGGDITAEAARVGELREAPSSSEHGAENNQAEKGEAA